MLPTLTYDGGTLLLAGLPDDLAREFAPFCQFDPRINAHRAEGRHYRTVVEQLRQRKIEYADNARQWGVTPWPITSGRQPFPHQTEAIDAWWRAGARGMVVLPTGTGKTFTAMLALQKAARPALIVTSTIDLLNQWYAELGKAFNCPVGLMGGGHHELHPITVTTYDSSYIYLEKWGNRFGLLVFDECHHLPGATYALAAVGALAPFRLGLTATPERADGNDYLYRDLVGDIVYRREIKELSGDFLAEYATERVFVTLSDVEMERYQALREHYKQFLADNNISLSQPHGLAKFFYQATRTAEGRSAYRAFRDQKQLSQAGPGKLDMLADLLAENSRERILIFTADNATVYKIARRFLIPAITHQTKAKERQAILKRFHSGEYGAVVTSQVLNEGVDVPAASLGIILSGTGSVREHVQRLGRLLRKHEGKQARLIEVVTRGTTEQFTSDRRRQHEAYQ